VKPSLPECLEAIDELGYVVLHDVVPPAVTDDVEAALRPLLEGAPRGRNPFEGHHTVRINNLLAKGDVFQQVAGNDDVLDLVEAVLGPHIQVSIISAIQILPGESAQGLHTDDGLYPLPHPHPPVVFNTMWAIDDFTAANGATRLVPGSHKWPDPRQRDHVSEADIVAAEMPRGSVLAWLGNLVHEGGPNATDAPRLGITMNYNQAWLRQQENQYLGIPREVVARFPERLQRLVGYDLHPPFIGNVDGRNPYKLLTR
jgi:ectoine hydroxylase-related dioxygenase (phytanoyl-CoA dioxygenase family)